MCMAGCWVWDDEWVFTSQIRVAYMHPTLCPVAEAVGCILWVVKVFAAARDSCYPWMRRSRSVDG